MSSPGRRGAGAVTSNAALPSMSRFARAFRGFPRAAPRADTTPEVTLRRACPTAGGSPPALPPPPRAPDRPPRRHPSRRRPPAAPSAPVRTPRRTPAPDRPPGGATGRGRAARGGMAGVSGTGASFGCSSTCIRSERGTAKTSPARAKRSSRSANGPRSGGGLAVLHGRLQRREPQARDRQLQGPPPRARPPPPRERGGLRKGRGHRELEELRVGQVVMIPCSASTRSAIRGAPSVRMAKGVAPPVSPRTVEANAAG